MREHTLTILLGEMNLQKLNLKIIVKSFIYLMREHTLTILLGENEFAETQS